ncbi:Predicted O-methyltransferase [Citrobacter youngae]|nr:Predicted O-methyltransferase [Citrobacter youngae]
MDMKSINKKVSINNRMNEFELIDNVRLMASVSVRNKRQKLNEQYFTPGFVTNFVAHNLIDLARTSYNILDVAAGVGNIGAAVGLVVSQQTASTANQLHAVEIDPDLVKECETLLSSVLNGTSVEHKIYNRDFLELFCEFKCNNLKFTSIVMNPPYKKFTRKDYDSLNLTRYNIEYSPNLYSLMMSCALELLSDNGELIAIVPRSFCSGTLFHAFRKKIVKQFRISFIHLFESRTKVFAFDGVQQETIIIKIEKRSCENKTIIISYGDDFDKSIVNDRSYSSVIFPNDNQHVIHIPYSEVDECVLNKILSYKSSLDELGLKVSTGKVVDFRNKQHLTSNKENNGLLFCKENLGRDCFIFASNKIQNFIRINESTVNKFLDKQCHVVMNRMFFKESDNVISAQVVDCGDNCKTSIAVENHLNYISGVEGSPLDFKLALGIKLYLESKLVSDYFKRFLGSTQINAADIKSLPFPSKEELIKLGQKGEFEYDE